MEKKNTDEITGAKKETWLQKTGSIVLLALLVAGFVILPKDSNLYVLLLVCVNVAYCINVMFKGNVRIKKVKAENPEKIISYVPLIAEVGIAFIYPFGLLGAYELLSRFVPRGSADYLKISIVILVAFVVIGLLKNIAWFRKEKIGSDERFDAGAQIFLQILIAFSILIEIF